MSAQENEESYDRIRKQAEIKKLEAETKALNQSHFAKPANWLPLFVGVGGIITALTQFQTADLRIQQATLKSQQEALDAKQTKFDLEKELSAKKEELRKVDSDKQALESQIAEQKERWKRQQELLSTLETQINEKRILLTKTQVTQPQEVKEIDRKIDQTVSELKAPESVYVQFRGALTRELMNELMRSFNDQGIPVPGVERVAGSYTSNVRYFHKTDYESAESISQAAIKFFASRHCPISDIKLQDLSDSKFKVKEGQLELWIYHSCDGS